MDGFVSKSDRTRFASLTRAQEADHGFHLALFAPYVGDEIIIN